MADNNESGGSGGWFPNINQLMVALLAGTFIITQIPFKSTRPDGPETSTYLNNSVDARLWQDPLDVVKHHLEKSGKEGESNDVPSLDQLAKDIVNKLDASDLKDLNVMVAMLPGGPYFEASETRRRIRYAVLSGFDAALRYQPEDTEHLSFFCIPETHAPSKIFSTDQASNGSVTNKSENNSPPTSPSKFCETPTTQQTGESKLTLPKQQGAYEWMVYKPIDHLNLSSSKNPNERRYEHPPILMLWLDNDKYRVSPYGLLTKIFDELNNRSKDQDKARDKWKIRVLGPYGSDTLQDMVVEVKNNTPENPSTEKPFKYDFSFWSPSATLPDDRFMLNEDSKDTEKCIDTTQPKSLARYFCNRDIQFIRTIATDDVLAKGIQQELLWRGIKPGKSSRVMLVGEWDTLYGWHLPWTVAQKLINSVKPPNLKCENKYSDPKDQKLQKIYCQDGNAIYDEKDQLVFNFSYLRGLDGEAAKNLPKNDKDSSSTDKKNSLLEEAEGESQFDYVRRLADEIGELDKRIRNNLDNDIHSQHAIQAIGILGSDFYDKDLILEALKEKFPDAVFFTNGLDDRFRHPKYNQWARNLVMVSSFDLKLDRKLQRDIPPFRDSNQTAYFLATEMALAKLVQVAPSKCDEKTSEEATLSNQDIDKCKKEYPTFHWFLGKDEKEEKDYKGLLTDSQVKIFEWFKNYRLNEVGRTRIFPLLQPDNQNPVHPQVKANSLAFSPIVMVLGVMGLILLWFYKRTKNFLERIGTVNNIVYALSVYVISVGFVHLITHLHKAFLPIWILVIVTIVGILYIIAIIIIAKSNEIWMPDDTPKSIWAYAFSFIFIIVILFFIWSFASPQGLLNHGEPYSLLEGVSMWPTEGLRFIAFILCGYFTLEVLRYPLKFLSGLEVFLGNIKLPKTTPFNSKLWLYFLHDCAMQKENISGFKKFRVLAEWLMWQPLNCRLVRGGLYTLVFYIIGVCLFYLLGFPHIPFRSNPEADGSTILALDTFLMRGLLVPAYLFLLALVIDATATAISFVDKCFPENYEKSENRPINGHYQKSDKMPLNHCVLKKIPKNVNIQSQSTSPIDPCGQYIWNEIRFVGLLTKSIYGFIGYPLYIAVLMVAARSSYFDNWVMPLALKIIIGASFAIIIFLDYRLKTVSDTARNRALSLLHNRIIHLGEDGDNGKMANQLEKIIKRIEDADGVVTKSFIQRPVFGGLVLIAAAVLADSVDFAALASKLF